MIMAAPRRFAVTNIWLLYRAQWLLAQLLRQDRESLSTAVPVAGRSGNHWIFGRVVDWCRINNSEPPSEVSQCRDLALPVSVIHQSQSSNGHFICRQKAASASFCARDACWRKGSSQQPPSCRPRISLAGRPLPPGIAASTAIIKPSVASAQRRAARQLELIRKSEFNLAGNELGNSIATPHKTASSSCSDGIDTFLWLYSST